MATVSNKETWETIKAEYLQKVTKALASARRRRRDEIIENVTSHLDEKFTSLVPDQQTWENMQKIIIEMGPPSDYAELLGEDVTGEIRKTKIPYILLAALLLTILIAAVLLAVFLKPPRISDRIHIISFKRKTPVLTDTAKNLLDSFYNRHADGAKTHHFRTEIKDACLIGHICVDSVAYRDSLVKRLDENETLRLVRTIAVTKQQFDEYCKMGQPSLERPSYIPQTSTLDENGRIIDKIDYPFVDDSDVIGNWQSVDFIGNIKDFKPGLEPGQMDLYL
ncbi:MAG: hypothetical protein ABIG61_16870, partial [Planctomycetota bacterium]